MVNVKKNVWAAVWGLVLCMLFCGCGAKEAGETVAIGSSAIEGAESETTVAAVGTDGDTAAPDVIPMSENGGNAGTEIKEIRVHVCGAVASPGVVSLPEDSRAEDALKAAGGFAPDAWQDYVNLAERVEDGEKLYFPTVDEKEGLSLSEPAKEGLVNINTADEAALCTLPGIGLTRAEAIMAYRETNGPFEKCEDVMKVSGIKESVYSKISGKITVR